MVELQSKRRKVQQKATIEKKNRYSAEYEFSALTYKQAPKTLALSPHSVLVSAQNNHFNALAGDFYLDKEHVYNSPIPVMEKHHKQNVITHLKWHPKGDVVASIDETGQLALWQLKTAVDTWATTYQLDLKQPLAAFLWLNTEPSYQFENGVLNRKKAFGPRNPYGHLCFLTVTVHGQIQVHYQRSGNLFSTFATMIPKTAGRREINRGDVGCFGMSLAGVDDWQRISHATIAFNKQGDIHLATHYASSQPKSIFVYRLDIKFPSNREGAIQCLPVTHMRINLPDISNSSRVTQLLLAPNADQMMELVIGLGDHNDDDGFSSFVGKWRLDKVKQSVDSNFGSFSTERTALVYVNGTVIKDKFVTCLETSSTGELIVGLSDGGIHIKSSEQDGLINSRMLDESIGSYYWQAFEPNESRDAVADVILSCNETHIIAILSSGKLCITRITEDDFTDHQITLLNQSLQCTIFNEIDPLDLISELVRASQDEKFKDIPDKIMNDALLNYEICYSQGRQNTTKLERHLPIEEWSLAQLTRAYGLALSVYKRLPNKQIHSINLSRAIQLPVILECFVGSCTSNYADIVNVLEKNATDIKLEFNADSLWSLVSLASWSFDYLRWILREWNMLFNRIRPHNSKHNDISNIPVHAALLIHKDSRVTLRKILIMTQHFIRYTSLANYQLSHIRESQPLLQKYVATLTDEPVSRDDAIQFLNALDNGIDDETTLVENRWTVLLKSTLQGYSIEKIKSITTEFKERCAKPAIYLDQLPPYNYDVIRKRRLASGFMTRKCIRCHEKVLPLHTHADASDPCSSAQWYQCLGRRCICGGIFSL